MRKPVIFSWTSTSNGITVRSWELLGRQGGPSVVWVRQTKEAYYGPAEGRPPGLWRRVLRTVLKGTGRSGRYYCPGLPPVWDGIEVSVLRYMAIARWRTRRQEQLMLEHFRQPCAACAAGWGRVKDAT